MRRVTVTSCTTTSLAVAVCLALLAGQGAAQPARREQPSSVAIVGSPASLLRSVGLETARIERARLPLDVIRHAYDSADPKRSAAEAMQHHVQTLSAFVTAWRQVAAADTTAKLGRGADRLSRARLEPLLEAAGFRLPRRNGHYVVERDLGEKAAHRHAVLLDAGFDIGRLDERLNGGAAIRFEVPSFDVPLPLTPNVWLNNIYQGSESPELLGLRILGDRRGALLYFGLMGTSPSTRTFLGANPGVLRQLYEGHANAMALYARGLVIDQDRDQMLVPGGANAEKLWGALSASGVEDPADFLIAVLGGTEQRLGFFYDAVAQLDPPHQRFALGLWLDEDQRMPRLRRLYDAFLGWANPLDPEQPFARRSPDPSHMLSVVQVHASGKPVAPAGRALWERVLGRDATVDSEPAVQGLHDADLVDAAWLAERIFETPDKVRDRLDAFLFGQRVFSDIDDTSIPDVLTALRGFASHPSLLLTLERLGIQEPRLYAGAVRHATRLDGIADPHQWAINLSQFQGALGIIERARHTRVLSVRDTATLVRTLPVLSVNHQGYEGKIGGWLLQHLLPTLRRAGCASDSAEGVLVEALTGTASADGAEDLPIINWEGWPYLVDVRGAVLSDVRAARQTASGNTLDAVLELRAASEGLVARTTSVERAGFYARNLATVAEQLVERSNPIGITVSETIARAERDIQRITQTGDLARAPQIGAELMLLADALLGDVLRSLVYAPQVGDPRGGVLNGVNVADRHDFGFDLTQGSARRQAAWMLPEARMMVERPWFVSGSLLSLDLATANLRLAQIPTTMPPARTILMQSDLAVVIKGSALFNQFARTQAEVERIAGALDRGRSRAARLRHTSTEIESVAEFARLSEWRKTQLAWMLTNDRDSLDGWFTIRELYWLGEDGADDTIGDAKPDTWGAAAFPANGCLCLSVSAGQPWENWRGRAGSGLVPSVFPDLSLWVAEGLAARQLPVELAGEILRVAVRHFVDRVRPQFPDDWDTVLRYPAKLTLVDFDEYVSSLTGAGALKPMQSPSPR